MRFQRRRFLEGFFHIWAWLEVKRFTEISVQRNSDVSVRFRIRFDEHSVRFGSFFTRKKVIKTLEK